MIDGDTVTRFVWIGVGFPSISFMFVVSAGSYLFSIKKYRVWGLD